MARYVGLGVSLKETSICVMNHDGSVAVEGEVASNPDAIAAFIAEHAANAERFVHESAILAIWLTRELERRGVPVICIDARLAQKALSGRINSEAEMQLIP